MRLDLYLFENNFFKTREKAKEAILQGIVSVDGKICSKPAYDVKENKVEIVGEKLKYVSRAGLKLEKAKLEWNIDFLNKVVLDVGASTGGFTDFAIQNGAKIVYAIDVGTGQLHQSLIKNPKVINMEKTDFRTMPDLPEKIDIAVCDCSFISLKLLLDKFKKVVPQSGQLVLLIKPQFECGKDIAKKTRGVIKDQKIQEVIKNDIINFYSQNGFRPVGCCDSPILGTAGNKEFLAYFEKE